MARRKVEKKSMKKREKTKDWKLINEITDENQKKEDRSKRMKPESTHLATFFFAKPKEGLTGGTTTAKTSLPPNDGSGIADNGATEEARAGAAKELSSGGAEELSTKATNELNTGAS